MAEKVVKAPLVWLAGRIAGVDEAGRGPLAGPVVAAAVILDPSRPIVGLNDSKKLSEKRRDALAPEIREKALAWAVAEASAEEIDRINILQATFLAMTRAVVGLGATPEKILVDGNKVPRSLAELCPAEAVVKGDGTYACIAAASILAKTHRDALMKALDRDYPAYGFAQHMGYPTAAHLDALQAHGPCVAHRRSFSPVAQLSLL
ncbi:ribonuclease HII [Oryzomicrobium sp.]|uniref:ribonuclease HII n=1 Tax=Oryzomicrobium sp. TaxID=1911578 RepID=UPI002FE3FAA3